MLGYTQVNKDELKIVKNFVKGGEICKISGEIKLNERTYRQIIYLKKVFLYNRLETRGFTYLNEDNEIVDKNAVINELNRLGYYYEVFFHENSGSSILDALKSGGAILRSQSEFEKVLGGLDILIEQKVAEAEKVKNVAIMVPKLREKSNNLVQEFSDKINDMKHLDINFGEDQLSKLYPYYEKVLKANFETVKHIAALSDCCDYVLKETDKKKRKLSVKLKSKNFDMLIKVSDELSYYRRLIKIYNSVLDMSVNQYIDFLRKANKEKIENRTGLIRSK